MNAKMNASFGCKVQHYLHYFEKYGKYVYSKASVSNNQLILVFSPSLYLNLVVFNWNYEKAALVSSHYITNRRIKEKKQRSDYQNI